jgi:hypothetical protein
MLPACRFSFIERLPKLRTLDGSVRTQALLIVLLISELAQ